MSAVDVLAVLDADIAWRKAAHVASGGEHENSDGALQRAIEARAAVAELVEASADLAKAVREETEYLAATPARAVSGLEMSIFGNRVMECTTRLDATLARMGGGEVSARIAIVCRKCGQHDSVTERQAITDQCFVCHTCKADYARKRRAARKAAGLGQQRNKENAAEYERDRSRRPEVRARRASDMARYAKDPELRIRHNARWQVRRAIAAGKLVRQPCEKCGVEPAHGHHDDYSKSLDVRWLCPAHHREHHARFTGEGK